MTSTYLNETFILTVSGVFTAQSFKNVPISFAYCAHMSAFSNLRIAVDIHNYVNTFKFM